MSPEPRSELEERLFRTLLALYPAGFRNRHGEELLMGMRLDASDQNRRRSMGFFRFWVHLFLDNLRAALRERTENRNDNRNRRFRMDNPLKHAFRVMVREPLYATVCILTLAIGIGSTTLALSVVQNVLLRPLPYPDAHELVRIYERERENPDARMVAYGNYVDLRASSAAFRDLAIWAYSSHILTGTDNAVQLRTREVSANFASTLGESLLLGRWILPQEENEAAHVVVLSHGIWSNQFGSDSSIVGNTITLDAAPYLVVGVSSPGFDFPFGAEAWVPLRPITDPVGMRRRHRNNMVARLADGVSVSRAQSLTDPIAARLEQDYPEHNDGNFFEVVSLQDDVVGSAKSTILMILGAAAALLAIACLNIASLGLARSIGKGGEMAVRIAIGASRARLAAQTTIETTFLALLGGGIGLAVAWLTLDPVIQLASGTIPRSDQVGLTLPVIGWVLLMSLCCGAILALIPVARMWKSHAVLGKGMLDGSRTSSSRGAVRGYRFLVGVELALAVALTTGAGLLVQSMSRLNTVDVGVDTESLLTMNVRLASARYPESDDAALFMDRLIASIDAVPGVEKAGATITLPANPNGWRNGLTMRDRAVPPEDVPPISYVVASPGYLEALGARLETGRFFEPGPRSEEDRVVVINRAAAERYWPEGDPLGKQILGNPTEDSGWMTIIGVVENIRQDLWSPIIPEVFVPMAQDRVLSMTLVARTTGDPLSFAPQLRQTIQEADPDIPISGISTLSDRIASRNARTAFATAILATIAVIALLLACIGVFGLLSFSVGQRRREFGIRIAVGATATRVLNGIFRETGVLVLIGIGGGLVGSYALSGALQSMLYQVQPGDPATLVTVSVAVLLVSLAAALLPARAATRVDPVTVLREE